MKWLEWLVPFKVKKTPALLYHMHEKLGQGKFGSVWRCTYQDRSCAAKVICKNNLDKPTADLLANEIDIWRSLTHQNLVRLFHVLHEPTRCVLICELLEGGTLLERHRRMHRLGTKPCIITILNGAEQIVAGIMYMHDNDFLHRDIKTENILLSGNQEVYKLGDFGLARSTEGREKTAETGSYRHMAPEVIRHEPYDKACDVYSFAMVLYEMVTLSVPFPHHTPVDAALAVARGERPPLPHIHSEVLILLTDCWQQTAARRPTCREVAERVNALKLKRDENRHVELQ